MRNFGAADRMTKIMERFGMQEGEELEHPWLNRSVETAQKRVEQRNYLQPQADAGIRRRDEQAARGRLRPRNEAIETEDPRRLDLRGHRRGRAGKGEQRFSRSDEGTSRTTPGCSTG